MEKQNTAIGGFNTNMIDLKRILSPGVRRNLMYGLFFLPDELYIKLFYFSISGKWMDLKNPKGFNEKQNWLKLHDKHPEYTSLVDKYAVRKHIDSLLGEGHLFPLLGKWKSFDDIDFSMLPNSFVLKCNHDSGSTQIIRDKKALSEKDLIELKSRFNAQLKKNSFYAGREYPYKGIKERFILAEQLMIDEKMPQKSIEDYKFFCFNGEPKVMFIATDRATDCRFDFFDMDFNHLDIENLHPHADKLIPKPEMFEEMKQIAAKLSRGMKFVRIDLYQLNGKIYFGEYTFFHGGGFAPFYPEEWERRLGNWIELRG